MWNPTRRLVLAHNACLAALIWAISPWLPMHCSLRVGANSPVNGSRSMVDVGMNRIRTSRPKRRDSKGLSRTVFSALGVVDTVGNVEAFGACIYETCITTGAHHKLHTVLQFCGV